MHDAWRVLYDDVRTYLRYVPGGTIGTGSRIYRVNLTLAADRRPFLSHPLATRHYVVGVQF